MCGSILLIVSDNVALWLMRKAEKAYGIYLLVKN